jgi:hypothetical protein
VCELHNHTQNNTTTPINSHHITMMFIFDNYSMQLIVVYVRVAGPMGCTRHIISLSDPLDTSTFDAEKVVSVYV